MRNQLFPYPRRTLRVKRTYLQCLMIHLCLSASYTSGSHSFYNSLSSGSNIPKGKKQSNRSYASKSFNESRMNEFLQSFSEKLEV